MKSIPYLISTLINSQNNEKVINIIFSLVKSDDIPSLYQALYKILEICWRKYNLIEPVSIFMEIENKYEKEADKKKLMKQFYELWDLVVSDAFWEHYLSLSLTEIKINKAKIIGSELSDLPNPININTMLIESKRMIEDIMNQYTMDSGRSLEDIINEYINSIDQKISGNDKDTITTGLSFEKHINGFHPGDFIILAGRPKMGKSAIANTIAVNALKRGKRVMLVNNEMDEQSIVNRLIANLYNIDINILQNPKRMDKDNLKYLIRSVDDFRQNYPLELYSMNIKTPGQLFVEYNKLVDRDSRPDFIIMDYLQLFRVEGKFSSRYDMVSELSWQVKMLASDLKVPILALSQVNRKCEERKDKRPVPSDLRESGNLEQDATAVMFVYRDEEYHENTKEPGIAEINVAINRNGTKGMQKYYMDFSHMRLSNIDNRS
ncbi:MAG: DnaB-like helicase C-terminal domain-containing protein [Candidatus Cloacimonas sp.]